MIKKIMAFVSAAALALGMAGCGDSDSTNAPAVSGTGEPDDSASLVRPVDTDDTEDVPGFSEKLSAFEELYNKYWEGHEKNNGSIGDGSSDTHTEEEKKEFKRKRIELLSPYPEEKLKAAIEEQCRCIRDNDPDKFMDCLNTDCLKYYESYYSDTRHTYNSFIEQNKTEKAEEYLKAEYTEDLFQNTSKELTASDWPENIKVSEYEITDCTTGMRMITENNDPTKVTGKEYVIEIHIRFRLADSDLCGEAQIIQTAEHDDLILVYHQISTVQQYSLKKVNSAAKLAFTVCQNRMSDKEADGIDRKKQINDGDYAKSASPEGLNVMSTEGLGEGDKYIAGALLDNGDENYTVCVRFAENGKISFAQAISSDHPGLIGQYPEPTVPGDEGKMTFGQYNDHKG